MRTFPVLLQLFFLFFGVNSFIVPDEVPSLLSVIYSNIPTLKKGTDSRLGWGFRLGDRADFQVLVELGPQQYTQPLANQGDNANNKRNTIDSLSDTLYAQRQEEKRQKLEREQQKQEKPDTEAAKWLDQWSKTVTEATTQQILPEGAEPGLAEGEIDAKSVLPDDAVVELLRLYKKLRRELDTRKKQEALVEKLEGEAERRLKEEGKIEISTESNASSSE